MTTLEQFHNDYIAHKGQCNLHLQSKLVNRLRNLHLNLCNIHTRLGAATHGMGCNNYFDPFNSTLNNIILKINTLGSGLLTDKDESANTNTKGANGDGAIFIYTMNLYTQTYYFLQHYLNTLPSLIRNEYMTILYHVTSLFNAYKTNLAWCISNSTYDPKYSKFFIPNNEDSIMDDVKNNKPLDKRISM